MPPSSAKADSCWVATLAGSPPGHPPLQGDLEVDVAIVGAGIVGLSAALLLLRGGHRAAVLEALQVGRQVTGRSTAKITAARADLPGAREELRGGGGARVRCGERGRPAQIVRFAEELGIECDLERKPHVYSRRANSWRRSSKRRRWHGGSACRRASVASALCPSNSQAPSGSSIRLSSTRANTSPRLAQAVRSAGGQLFEGTRARSIEHGEPCRVTTDQGVVTARDVIDATHMPLVSEGKFFAKAYPYAHALVAARVDPARAPDGMFISAEQPTHSVRTGRWGDKVWLVAAGGSFKPGRPRKARRR